MIRIKWTQKIMTRIKRTKKQWSTKHYISSEKLSYTKLMLKTKPGKNYYDRNGNTSKYYSISGQNICMTGMVILVSSASLVDRTYV
jgi:hypothetical protein